MRSVIRGPVRDELSPSAIQLVDPQIVDTPSIGSNSTRRHTGDLDDDPGEVLEDVVGILRRAFDLRPLEDNALQITNRDDPLGTVIGYRDVECFLEGHRLLNRIHAQLMALPVANCISHSANCLAGGRFAD